jgi:curved DNA-binding protein CbpA
MPDYWAMLEVERGAGSEAVKDSYRRLQKVYHPDKAQVSPKSPPRSYSRYNLAGFETTGPDVANVLFCPLSGSIFQAGP